MKIQEGQMMKEEEITNLINGLSVEVEWRESIGAVGHHPQCLLEGLLEGATDSHHFSDGFHWTADLIKASIPCRSSTNLELIRISTTLDYSFSSQHKNCLSASVNMPIGSFCRCLPTNASECRRRQVSALAGKHRQKVRTSATVDAGRQFLCRAGCVNGKVHDGEKCGKRRRKPLDFVTLETRARPCWYS